MCLIFIAQTFHSAQAAKINLDFIMMIRSAEEVVFNGFCGPRSGALDYELPKMQQDLLKVGRFKKVVRAFVGVFHPPRSQFCLLLA